MRPAQEYAELWNGGGNRGPAPFWCGIPDYMQDGLALYLLRGVSPGHFLSAVLSNDLKEAIARADDTNCRVLREYMVFLYNNSPAHACYGSPEKVAAWIKSGGMLGQAPGAKRLGIVQSVDT